MSYDEFIQKPSSEKILLCWLEPAERLLEWTVHSGSIYKRNVEYYIISLKEDGDLATKRDSIGEIVGDKEYFFDDQTKILYYQSYSGSDPSTNFVVGFYRIPFSNRPIIAPIGDGLRELSYSPTLTTSPKFAHKLDHADQFGIALSSNSNLSFINDDFFIENYDRLIWKNKAVTIYSTSPELTFSEKRLYFKGIIDDKSYTDTSVKFRVKDFFTQLKERVPLDTYDEDDGDLPDSRIGKAKRRIYGRVNGLQVIPTNQILNGFDLAGAWTADIGETTVTGSGGNLLEIARREDKIIFEDDEYTIASITNDNEFILSEEVKTAFTDATLTIQPEIQSLKTGRNTEYVISDGHALKALSTTIVSQIQRNKFELASTDSLLPDDIITIDGETRVIRRVITGNIITLTQRVSEDKVGGETVTKNPVQKVYENGFQLTPERDYTISNLSTGATMTLDLLAEFNIQPALKSQGTYTFTNGSNEVTVTDIDLKGNIGLRDWVKPDDIEVESWIEVLDVDEENSKIILKEDYTDTNFTGTGLLKRITPIGDSTVVTVECFGKTEDNTADGVFIETGAQVVKDLLLEAGIDDISTTAFDNAALEAPQLISLPLPLEINQQSPTLKKVFEHVNQSIFGSLHFNNDFEIEYSVLTSGKPNELLDEPVTDSDIVGWSAKSTGRNILRKVIGHYQFQDADRFTDDSAFSVVDYDNEFVQRVVETNREETFNFYLFNEADAQIMVERKSYYNQVAQSIFRVGGKLNLGKYAINDKILLNLDRLYGRFGSIGTLDNRKIMIVSGVERTNDQVSLELDDLGNIWNRTAAITADDAVEFTSSTDEKIINGYITDSDGLIDLDKETYQINLIG